MKRSDLLINLSIVILLLFCMAFACNNNDEKGDTTNDERPSQSNVANSGLPVGKYTCFTTYQSYAGRGAGGYPIYNFSKQSKGTIDIKSNGTYLNPDGGRCGYSYDAENNDIEWLDCAFKEASSSQLTTDDNGTPSIQIKFNGDKDVWDCTKQ